MPRFRFRQTVPLLVLLALLLALPRPAQADDLSDALLLPELFDIMAEEGRNAVVQDEEIPLRGGVLAQFQQDVAEIYTPERLQMAFLAELDTALEAKPDLRADVLAFAKSELGRKVLRLEISARAAMLDDTVDDATRLALADARAAPEGSDRARRLALVRARIDANDLIELNVSLGLNTSYAYFQGLLAEGAVPGLTASELVPLVWAQETEIRNEIEDWIESYFLMAYQPLDEGEFSDLLDYVNTPLAVEFNQVMFRAFDTVFSDVSQKLGAALGRRMQAEEL